MGYDVDAFGSSPFVDDTDDVFAIQLLLGLYTEISDHVYFEVGYRLLSTENPILTDATGARLDAEYVSHTLDIGLRWAF